MTMLCAHIRAPCRDRSGRRPGLSHPPILWRLRRLAWVSVPHLMRMAAAVCAVAVAPVSERGAEGQEPQAARVSAEGVTLNFQDAEIRSVIASLAELAGLAVVYSGLPDRLVTLRTSAPLSPVELRRLLEMVIRSHGLEMVEDAGVLHVLEAPSSDVTGMPFLDRPDGGSAGNDDVRVFVHRLRHTRAETLAQTIREVFGIGGRGEPADRRPLSPELRGHRMSGLGNEFGLYPAAGAADRPGEERNGVAPGLDGDLRGAVRIVPDPLSNALLIRATAADYQTLRTAIDELDARPLQVLIEVLILEVRRDRGFELGVDGSVADRTVGESMTIGGELTSASAGDLTLRVLGLGGIRADLVLRAIASRMDVTILARPAILAQNNQTARILVGAQRPFVQLFRALPTDAAVRDQVVQYRDVGTQLTITPTINLDGYVTLGVLQEVSTATAEVQFGAPVISTREAETQLFVRDGHTVIIGGLIDHQEESIASGIPLLKDFPILGVLFRSTRRRRAATELFLLITPHVLRADQDLEDATRRFGDGAPRLRREIERIKPLQEPNLLPPDRRPPPDARHPQDSES